MFTTRSDLTLKVLTRQNSLMNSWCVLACCCSGLWSSFPHLAGFLWLKNMPRRSCLTHVAQGRTSSPSASSHSCTTPLIVTALRHRTWDTLMMNSLSRVMSAGESKVFLRSGAGRGAPFPAVGSVPVDPSNILEQKRRTSLKHRCTSHRRAVLHQWHM